MPKGKPTNLYVSKEQIRMLEVIAEEMGKNEIGIRPTRSQLVSKAIENYIEACRGREDLRRAMEAASTGLNTSTMPNEDRRSNARRLQVISSVS